MTWPERCRIFPVPLWLLDVRCLLHMAIVQVATPFPNGRMLVISIGSNSSNPVYVPMLEKILNIEAPEEFNQIPPGFPCDKVELCAIINIKSGHCNMDCSFCIQSRHTAYAGHPLLPAPRLLKHIIHLSSLPLKHIGLVAAGASLHGEDFDTLCKIIEQIPEHILPRICLSLGRLPTPHLETLHNLGIRRYHHNLETSRQFYPHICTTQKWEQRAQTVINARAAGLEICSGGIFGLGEDWLDRLALAESLLELGVKNVPLNFLHPQPGTPLAQKSPLTPLEALKTIALFRHIMPEASLRVCGGRPLTFGNLQHFIFRAGANALMTGDYLTTSGSGLAHDLELINLDSLLVDAPSGLA